MRSIIVICFCALVLAAPQGYDYNSQQNNLSVGLPNFNPNSQVDTRTTTQESHGFLQHAVNSGNLQQTLFGGQSTPQQNSHQFSAAPHFSTFAQQNVDVQQEQQQQDNAITNLDEQQQQAALTTNFIGQEQKFNGFQQQQTPIVTNFGTQQQEFSAFQHQQQNQYQVPGPITKDIYIHVAPEDGTDQEYQQPALPPPPPRKHYRIVFIKAPTQSTKTAALRIQQAPIEEKTIIYVLTKKPDPLDLQAAIQQVQPKPPSKPEVYFIKYKTQEEAKHAQRTIQAQYDKLGGTSQVSDEGVAPVASVIGSLDGTQKQQQQQRQQQRTSLGLSNGSGHASSSSTTYSSSTSLNPSGAVNSASKYLPPIVKM